MKRTTELLGAALTAAQMPGDWPTAPLPPMARPNHEGRGNNADPRDTKPGKKSARRMKASNPGSHHHAGYLKRAGKRRQRALQRRMV